MNVNKVKRKLRRWYRSNDRMLRLGGIIAIVLLLAVVVSVNHTPKKQDPIIPEGVYELTETDVFASDGVTAWNIAVHGIMLGDSAEKMLNTLGSPDIQNDVPPSIVNFEYAKVFGLEETGIIVHTVDGTVRRITVKPPFNDLLHGETKADITKEKMVALFGKPDRTSITQLKKSSGLVLRNYHYEEIGLMFTTRKKEIIGFTLRDT